MKRIVISYRRSDSRAITARIHEKLSEIYGQDAVFRDIDSINTLDNFRKRIAKALRHCDLVIAVIGPDWRGRGEDGKFRIDDAEDWVRSEVETAMQFDIPVLPVLVEGARMPAPSELPASMRPLTDVQALSIDTDKRFYDDIDDLVATINKVPSAFEHPAATPASAAPAQARAARPAEATARPRPKPAAASPARPSAPAGQTAAAGAATATPSTLARILVPFPIRPEDTPAAKMAKLITMAGIYLFAFIILVFILVPY